ncbi:MAG: glycosyltransferase family 4 protein [Spirochaetia bacterium]|jgi:1,2-diacylglycerol-3-alpha-glucose alpha-1,2-glucosyltransferase|nr:glycosyltransferase family 4 protein [Spirochaetia bacterium]
MGIYLYLGGLRLVGKSGIGQAIVHQRKMISRLSIPFAYAFADAEAVQVNTIFLDSLFVAIYARIKRKKIIYYAHSTMEDFCNSFRGSDILAPLFQKWICFCYGFADVIITPTVYSRDLLIHSGITKPIKVVSNGVDTQFFKPDRECRLRFRKKFGFSNDRKVVISVGHYMERKGIVEFIELARSMPQVTFLWFGYTAPYLIPSKITKAIAEAPDNLQFPGYVDQEDLRDAYCGSDVFVFLSHEETEGIVVLEALACGTDVIVRDIPVYDGWLKDGRNVYKANGIEDFQRHIELLLNHGLPSLVNHGQAVAASHSIQSVSSQLDAAYRYLGLCYGKNTKRCLATCKPDAEKKGTLYGTGA